MSKIIGHAKILDFFEHVERSGRLHHAYCFVGSHHIGKRTVAVHLAARLLNTVPEKIGQHPDLFMVEKGINEKTGKTKKNIDIDQIRHLRSILSQQPFLAKYKVAIIDQAEKMTVNAANGLLKTLEEPRPHTILFLLALDEEDLPKTILSRCHSVYFQQVQVQNIEQALHDLGMNKEDASAMALLSLGCPGRALSWARDPETFDAYKQEIMRFTHMSGKPFYEKLKAVEELFGDPSRQGRTEAGKTDHIATRHKLENILHVWHTCVRDILVSSFEAPASRVYSSQISWPPQVGLRVAAAIERALHLISQNIHPRLLIEQILLAIP